MRPNLFDLATKELSQDAFITWFISWADDGVKCEGADDLLLQRCAKEFVRRMISMTYPNHDVSVKKVIAGRQWENVDVWAEVDDKYLIIIESKTFTDQHSNQLSRYKEVTEEWCSDPVRGYEKPVCIYFKTGSDSKRSFDLVEKNGFSVFSRKAMIDLFQGYSDIQNHIFQDFKKRIERMESTTLEFENKIIGDWTGDDWMGFFQYLDKEHGLVNWHYVNNASGGFWNAVLNWEQWKDYPVYLQIEEGKLCFKICTDPEEIELPEDFSRAGVRNEFSHLVLTKANDEGRQYVRRPYRFGHGKYMTTAIVEKENWLGANDKKIDKAAVLGTLDEYLAFLKGTLHQQSDMS